MFLNPQPLKRSQHPKGMAAILMAGGLITVLAGGSLISYFTASRQAKVFVSAINQNEGFYNSEIAAWHAYYRGTAALPTQTDPKGYAAGGADASLFKIYDALLPTTLGTSITSPSNSQVQTLTLRGTASLDTSKTTIRRYSGTNIRFLPKAVLGATDQYCGNSDFAGDASLYRTCLTVETVDPFRRLCPLSLCPPGWDPCFKSVASNTPIPIRTEAEFRAMESNKHYVLQNDIALTLPVPVEPTGEGSGLPTYKKLIFDGGNHTISNITGSGYANGAAGLFGMLECAMIKDLTLSNISISIPAPPPNLGGTVGALAAQIDRDTVISNIQVLGGYVEALANGGGLIGYLKNSNPVIVDITTDVTVRVPSWVTAGMASLGGIVGLYRPMTEGVMRNWTANGDVIATNCGGYVGGAIGEHVGVAARPTQFENIVAHGAVTAGPSIYQMAIGGLAGRLNDMNIKRCSSTGAVTASTGAWPMVGGLIGKWDTNGQPPVHMENSFSHSAVTWIGTAVIGTAASVGGLVGNVAVDNNGGVAISKSYASGVITCGGAGNCAGGLLGGISCFVSPCTSDSYWNTQTTGRATSASPSEVGLTTTQMQSTASFPGWDFNTVWKLDSGAFPTLR